MTPHAGPHWGTLPLLVAIIVVKYLFSRKLVDVGVSTGSTAVGIEAWHHLADALTTGAAFIGISVAVWGGKGYETADDWAAVLAAVVIAWNGVSLARKALDDVMDVAAPVELEGRIRSIAGAVPGVHGLDKCRIRKSGLSYLVDLHVEVDGALTVTQGHDIAGAVKHALIVAAIQVSDVNVHIEPRRA